MGAYVGVATAAGFLWWYLSFAGGPKLSWGALTSFQKCEEAAATAAGYSCKVCVCVCFMHTRACLL